MRFIITKQLLGVLNTILENLLQRIKFYINLIEFKIKK